MSTATEYYDKTAAQYDALRTNEPEHTFALEIGWPLIGDEVQSVLDVGCGTGRGLSWLAQEYPTLELHGIEPSVSMIAIAAKRLASADIRQGIGERLPFQDESIDVVTATGIMHHADNPALVISEMFRVARTAVLISDHNNYAFGGAMTQRIRIGLKVCGLLKAVNFLRQGFNHRGYSEEDGWWYPYSLFDNYTDIAKRSSRLYIFPTRPAVGSSSNILFSQGHFALVAMKAAS
ncbi:class I SAM-dependent methyltransferase [Bradyrhizobium ganzhouense]|uniref:class I SAM-dependent methyltransferase n=1 Tax=Bradyrhizobium ganzhouense TaxID=1179767 RepID=UPI003CE849AC